jgi:hypothetical protein
MITRNAEMEYGRRSSYIMGLGCSLVAEQASRRSALVVLRPELQHVVVLLLEGKLIMGERSGILKMLLLMIPPMMKRKILLLVQLKLITWKNLWRRMLTPRQGKDYSSRKRCKLVLGLVMLGVLVHRQMLYLPLPHNMLTRRIEQSRGR